MTMKTNTTHLNFIRKEYRSKAKSPFLGKNIKALMLFRLAAMLSLLMFSEFVQGQSCVGGVIPPGMTPITLDGTSPPYVAPVNCPPLTRTEASNGRGFMFGCTPGQAGCSGVTLTEPTFEAVTVVCPLQAVQYERPIPAVSVHMQYWHECVGVSFPAGVPNNNYGATNQGFINQLFCTLDGNGYPAAPGSIGAPASGNVNFIPSRSGQTLAALAQIGVASCSNRTRTEMFQLDFWLLIPNGIDTIGFSMSGGLFDAGLIMVGEDLSSMCATVDYVDPGCCGGTQGLETSVYYEVPSTATVICGAKLLRTRLYITDAGDSFTANPQFNIGGGFMDLEDIPNLVAIAATGPNDNTAPTVMTEMVQKGFIDDTGKVFDLAGVWEIYACTATPTVATDFFPSSVIDLGMACTGEVVNVDDIDDTYNTCTGDAVFTYSTTSPNATISNGNLVITAPGTAGTITVDVIATGPDAFPTAEQCMYTLTFELEVIVCCTLDVTCPMDVTLNCDSPMLIGGTAENFFNTYGGVVNASCAPVTYSFLDGYTDPGDCGVMDGVTIRITDVTDIVDCAFTITIQDMVAPVITCPADLTIECDESIAPANTGSATAMDNCSAAALIEFSDNATGLTACNGTGMLVRTWTATDDCGNSSSCDQNIVIEDSTPPAITCPADVTIECDASILPANTGSATATDNCQTAGTIAITSSDNTAGLTGCNSTGTLVRTWVATDDCGNSSSCDQNIVIEDTTTPVITCPADVTIECDASILPANTGSATATDNCQTAGTIAITSSDNTAGLTGCNSTGTLVRTWVATDDCGNSSSCDQNIVIEDTTTPVITCPADVTIECDASILPANTGSATATDNCQTAGTIAITSSDNTAGLTGCNSTGTLVRTWVATDDCGNSSSCDQNIVIEDTTTPVITCPADVTIECDASILPANTGSATATDNCQTAGTIAITSSDNTAGLTGCNSTGTLVRTWVATDDCGNSSSCDQNIVIEDTTPPVITCPADVTIECDASILPANTGSATATDNCQTASTIAITSSDNTAGLTGCNSTGTLVRTWVATDDCGNSSSCDQNIVIEDTTTPVITCPADVTIECDASILPANTGSATATDNCQTASTIAITSSDNTAGLTGCNSTGTLVRTWVATDDCGNSSSCDQNIVIEDTTTPVITCPADVTIECDASILPANTGSATATDNCQTASTIAITSSDNTAGLTGCNSTGTLVRTWVATDDCGNSSSCDQNIVIEDTTTPVITCPADVTIECDASILPANTGSATATDNCQTAGTIAITSSDNTAGLTGCNSTGTLVRTWVATDDCGNSSSCDQNIVIEDTTAPVITCPADVTIECDESVLPANTGSATATDNCQTAGTIAITSSDNTAGLTGCNSTGTLVRTWVATDDCGNSSSCDQNIVIEDTTAPVITCPADVSVECDESMTVAITGIATATDNCQTASTIAITSSDNTAGLTGCNSTGTIVRTWVATDDCGNSSSCDQNIVIEDTTAPVITCPADVTIECDESILPANTGSATATDNCQTAGTIAITSSDNTAGLTGCNSTGTLIRTWVATDGCGNSSSCDQNITIEDTMPPVITVVANDMTIECDGVDKLAELQAWLDSQGGAMGRDNCGGVSWQNDFTGLSDECGETGSATVTFIIFDDCGNQGSSTVATFTIIDTTPPEITAEAQGVTVECNDKFIDFQTWYSTRAGAEAMDLCGGVVWEIKEMDAEYYCNRAYSTTYRFIAIDDCGNASYSEATYTVEDSRAPEIILPFTEMTIECGEDHPEFGEAKAEDLCDQGFLNLYYDDQIEPGDCDQEYDIVRTWYAVDDCGNMGTAQQIVHVVDTQAPSLTFSSNSIFAGLNDGETYFHDCSDPLVFDEGDVVFSDNCSAGPHACVLTRAQKYEGNCSENGYFELWQYTWIATDDCGNEGDISVFIAFTDNDPPVFIFVPDDLTIACGENPVFGIPVVEDNCTNLVQMAFMDDVNQVGDCEDGGHYITRTWTATDRCGNAVTASQTIYFIDSNPIRITHVPADKTINCDEIIEFGTIEYVSNCGKVDLTYEDTEVYDPCVSGSVFTRTWLLIGECGAQLEASQTIIIRPDTEAPVILTSFGPMSFTSVQFNNWQPNIVTYDACSEVAVLGPFFESNENCEDLSLRVSWVAMDGCGNEATMTHEVEILDPRPEVDVVTPEQIAPGSIVYLFANVVGASGMYEYEWSIIDANERWEILGDNDVDSVRLRTDQGECIMLLSVTDLYGCTVAHEIHLKAQGESVGDLTIQPNPTSDKVMVEFTTSQGGEGHIELYDREGRLVQFESISYIAGVNEYDLYLRELRADKYTIRVVLGDLILSNEVIKVGSE